MRTKQRMVTNDDTMRAAIANMAGLVLEPGELNALHASHLHMYALFGDPAMRIAYPHGDAAIDVAPGSVSPGGQLQVDVTTPLLSDGTAWVTLESERSVIAGKLVPVPADGDPNRDAAIKANYTAANDKVVASVTKAYSSGKLSTAVDVPATLPPGKYHVKVYAEDGTSDAFGSAAVTVGP